MPRQIVLTQGRFVTVDDEDYEWLSQWKWQCKSSKGKFYAGRTNGVLMHRVITDAPRGLDVDHIDGDGLNNQRNNLRIATRQQNLWNQPAKKWKRYKGVYRHNQNKNWVAQIRVNRRVTHIGVFSDEISAAKAYDAAAVKHYGEFARLNFPT